MIGLLRRWGASLGPVPADDFYAPGRWRDLGAGRVALAFLLVPLAAYSATYLQQALHSGNPLEIVESHIKMRDILSGDAGTHPYSSNWWQWPALIRPVWYFFKIPGGDAATWSEAMPAIGIVALANPPITLLGECAVLLALWRWTRTRSLGALLVATAFLAQFLPWIINPKGLEFSFSFFPSLLALPPAIALALAPVADMGLRRALAGAALGIAFVGFVFFLPIYSAAIGGVSPERFDARIWLPSWR